MTRLFFTLFLLHLIGGCNSTAQKAHQLLPLAQITELKVADGRALPRMLNVSIEEFETVEQSVESVYLAESQVRSVEQRYLPFKLRQTLDRAGYWGAVRVLPEPDNGAELQVYGQIIKSSGIELKLKLRAVDATGRTWLDQVYHDVTDDIDYAVEPEPGIDPFQHLYNRIANDLVTVLLGLEEAQRQRIVDTATIQYAKGLSAAAFGRYLGEDESGIRVISLPSRDDPLLQGVHRIRQAEYLFADSVDAHYESLYHEIGLTYAWWRYYSHELLRGNERLEKIDITRGATSGSWYAVERVYKTFKEAKMNQDALRELTDSFDRETAPTLTEVSGRVIELKGSLDGQYRMWRRILRDMYQEEMGL